jgi:hypothetical protein
MNLVDHPTRHLSALPPSDPPADSVVVRAWWDPELATYGFDPRSPYVERFWLGVLGPSTVFLIRRLARGLEEHPGGYRIDLADTARAIGLGGGTGRQSPIARTIDRACMFKTMRLTAPGQLEVRTHLPKLTPRQLERLPPPVRASHDAWLAHPSNWRGPQPHRPGPEAA